MQSDNWQMKYLALMLALFSPHANAGDDTCIEHEGHLVLFALPGCYRSIETDESLLYGLWERADGTKEMICWKYDKLVLVYTNHGDLAFLPTEVQPDCTTLDDALPSNPELTHPALLEYPHLDS